MNAIHRIASILPFVRNSLCEWSSKLQHLRLGCSQVFMKFIVQRFILISLPLALSPSFFLVSFSLTDSHHFSDEHLPNCGAKPASGLPLVLLFIIICVIVIALSSSFSRKSFTLFRFSSNVFFVVSVLWLVFFSLFRLVVRFLYFVCVARSCAVLCDAVNFLFVCTIPSDFVMLLSGLEINKNVLRVLVRFDFTIEIFHLCACARALVRSLYTIYFS